VKKSTIVPIYKMDDKTECSNYRGKSLLPTTYTILSNILVSRLAPYTDETIKGHKWGLDGMDQLVIRYSVFVRE
jgi:hypothetical protein